ncbi:Lipase A [Fusarium culmorum]|uniref:Lipase A n=1 Tax=Fusarium culmorum TaxID=5516 RepID=A0A2T4GT61_FUSCU|nr:Lipase A [Fusarium culmorum]
MTSQAWLRDLCAAVRVADASVDTDTAIHEQALPPKSDPWYQPPQGWESKQPGDVLRISSAPALLKAVESSSSVYHILYRSSDSKGEPSWAVTTLFIPPIIYHSPSGKMAILSYQPAYNSCNLNSSPSYALAGVMARNEPNLGIKSTTSLIDELVSFGWVVSIPDHLGPSSAFGASVQGGHATLDGIRAVHHLLDLESSSRCNTTIWGYSEVKIDGTVLGGLVDNVSGDFDKINKSPIAGSLVSILVGITSQYPEARKYLESCLVPAMKDEFMSVLDMEVTETVKHFFGRDIYSFFQGGVADIRAPQLQKLYDEQAKLGSERVPSMPMFVYKAINDQFCPTEWTDVTIDRLCKGGADITYERNTVGSHVSEIENGKPGALRFLWSIFDGSYVSPAGKRSVSDVTVDVSG